jgi:hypothetical protein
MTRSVRLVVLRLLPAVTVVAVGIKAAGLAPGRATPREIADAYLAEARAGGSEPAAPEPAAAGGPLFTDVAPALGIEFTHDNAFRGNFLLPEQMGPGAGFADIDNDGDLDIFIAGGGAIIDDGPDQTCRLYRNDGDRFTDISAASGADVTGPGYGVACADYDADGDVDIFLSRLGPNALLRNDGDAAGPKFTEVARETGTADPGFGASAVFFDYDRDGRLDLYVANYVGWSIGREAGCYTTLGIRDYCNPLTYGGPSADRLYHNLGDGRFADVSDQAGITAETGHGLGVLASDFDGDGWVDLFVANDQTPALLWRNNGDGTFHNVAALAGCAYDGRGMAIAGMGVAAEDVDADGDFDLFVTNIRNQTHLVLRNDGGIFEDVSLRMGLGRFSVAATTFGVALFDQDADGAFDAFLANGEVNVDNALPAGDNPYAQPDHFVRLAEGTFVDATDESGASFADIGRGVAAGDYDDDGDLDLLVTNNGGPVRLLRNNNDTGNSWLGVEVRRGPGLGHAIGARLIVTAGGRTQQREIRPQQSYLCSGDPRAYFGLGAAPRVDRLEVQWPDGTRTVRTDVAVNQYVLIEGEENPGGPAS